MVIRAGINAARSDQIYSKLTELVAARWLSRVLHQTQAVMTSAVWLQT